MRSLFRLSALFLPVLHVTAFAAEASASPPLPAREQFAVYLLMGQSNMVGRDTRLMDAQAANPRVLVLGEDGHWVVGHDPVFAPYGKIPPGVSPGLAFANAMLAADPKVTIGLVPCAVGGTPLRRWVKGGDLYERALSRARTAAGTGTLVGVLWHQGESDTDNEQNAATYQARLTGMFKDLRADLGRPELPIVVGQLGTFLTAAKYPYVDTVRAAIRRMPELVPHVAFADSVGLGDKGDQLHFSSDAQREFGRRYAAAMRKLEAAEMPKR